MKQEIVVNKVLRDWIKRKMIKEEYSKVYQLYLEAIYVAGWEERGKAIGENIRKKRQRKVFQFDHRGRFIEEYQTVRIAAKKAHHTMSTIYKLLHSGELSTKHHYWKYEKGAEELTPAPTQTNSPNQPKTYFTC